MQTTETVLARCLCWRKHYPVAGIPSQWRCLALCQSLPLFSPLVWAFIKISRCLACGFPSCVTCFLDVRTFRNGTNCIFSLMKKNKGKPFTLASQLSGTESTSPRSSNGHKPTADFSKALGLQTLICMVQRLWRAASHLWYWFPLSNCPPPPSL